MEKSPEPKQLTLTETQKSKLRREAKAALRQKFAEARGFGRAIAAGYYWKYEGKGEDDD